MELQPLNSKLHKNHYQTFLILFGVRNAHFTNFSSLQSEKVELEMQFRSL